MANGNRKTLKIHWKEPGYRYIDLIPYKWFKHDVVGEDKCYSITDPRGKFVTQAKCKISVSGSQAILYYGGSNKKHNECEGINIGTTRVTFHDKNRKSKIGVHKIEWEDEHDLRGFFKFLVKFILHKKEYDRALGQFWLEIDEADGQGQHEQGRPEQYPGQVVWYTGRIKRWLVVLAIVVMLIVAVIISW